MASAASAQYVGKVSCHRLDGKQVIIKGYGGEGESVLAQVSCPSDVHHDMLGLPFTGLDIGLIALGGILLVIVGLALRSAAQHER